MRAKSLKEQTRQGELFKQELTRLVPKHHELRLLSERIEWSKFEDKYNHAYSPDNGRPAIPVRILLSLQMLKYMFNLSDEGAVERLSDSPSWQYFCGLRYYEFKQYCDATTLVKFRQKIGKEGIELLLSETVRIGKEEKIFKSKDLDKIHVDTTVQEKNVTYPHDVKHLVKMHKKLLKALLKKKIKVNQSFKRVIKLKSRLYFNRTKANHWKRANKYKREICTCLKKLIRQIEFNIKGSPVLEKYFQELIKLTNHFIAQARGKLESNSDKLYSPHEQEVQCIAKGKAHKKYEYGCKVSFVTTDRNNFIVGCMAFPASRPHDSKTLTPALEQVEHITGIKPSKLCSVDLGYRGHGIKKKEIFVIHPKLKILTKAEKQLRKRRSKSESVISFVKRNCRMGVNYLKGTLGDSINALSAAVAYNLRLIGRQLVTTLA